VTRKKKRPPHATPIAARLQPEPAPPVRSRALLAVVAAATLALSGAVVWRWVNADVPATSPGPAVDRSSRATPAPPGASLDGRHGADPGFLGVVLSGESVSVEPKADGRIVTLSVHAGDRVIRGAVIAELDRAVRDQDVRSARAAFADASSRFTRRAALAKGPDPAVTAEELDAARSQLAQERARLAAVSAALAETQVVAPFDGTVAEIYLAAGALAGPGRPVARVVSQGQLQVRFAMSEQGAGAIVAGTPIDIEIGSLGLRARGTVTGVNPEVDSSSRMIFAAARLDVPEDVARRLTTGLVARVRTAPIAPLEVTSIAAPFEGVAVRAPIPAPPPARLPPDPPVAENEAVESAMPAPRARVRRARPAAPAMPRW
jgi:RND family efflux transporter MFP subunit